MDIVIAKNEDISNVMHLIGECIKDMESEGIYQWNEFYPSSDIIAEDVQNGSMYIIQNMGDCLGVISLDEEESPEYGDIKWLAKAGKVLFVHRLAVQPKWQKQGIGRKLMDFAEEFAIKNGYTSIRLDVYSGNPRAIDFYERRGYKRTGEVYFPMRELAFFCYERLFGKLQFGGD